MRTWRAGSQTPTFCTGISRSIRGGRWTSATSSRSKAKRFWPIASDPKPCLCACVKTVLPTDIKDNCDIVQKALEKRGYNQAMKSTEPIYFTDADRQEMIHIAQGTERFFFTDRRAICSFWQWGCVWRRSERNRVLCACVKTVLTFRKQSAGPVDLAPASE